NMPNSTPTERSARRGARLPSAGQDLYLRGLSRNRCTLRGFARKVKQRIRANLATNQVRRAARRQERGVRRAEAVLDAAEQVFAEVGYDQATTAAVASRAGISPGSRYQFFPNKQAIAQALGLRC